MSHHGHGGSASHHQGHAGAFDDERHVRRLEVEARLASGLYQEAARLCEEQFAHSALTVGRVLDLGCGPGVATALLARRFASARVVAADGSATMLARAEALAVQHAVGGRVEARLIDLDGDLHPLGAADLVWAAMALHHAADELATLRELRELLTAQGLLCVLERADPTVVRLATDLGRPAIWDRVTASWSAWSRRARPTLPGGAGAGRYPELLDAAGLQVVDARTLRDTVTAPDDEETRTFVAEQLTATVRALDGLAEPTDLAALQGWIDDPAAHAGAATVTSSRVLLIARATTGHERR
jgi:trans-aconitate methyltransferase